MREKHRVYLFAAVLLLATLVACSDRLAGPDQPSEAVGGGTLAASTEPPDWICVVWVFDDGEEVWFCERVYHLDPNITPTACQNGGTPPDCFSWEAFEPPPPPTFDSTGIGGGESDDDDAPPPPPDEEPGDCDDSPEGCEEEFNEEPTLTCSETVLRGQPMGCQLKLEGNAIDGTEWEATLGDGFEDRDQGSPTEVHKWWGGPLAVDVVIQLDLYKNGTVVKSFTRFVSVEPRSWGWQANDNSVFKLTQANWPAAAFANDVPLKENVENGGIQMAGSAMDPGQQHGVIRPDPAQGEAVTSGYTASPAIPVGPNEGLVYVDTASFESRRHWSMNPYVLENGPGQWQTSGQCPTGNWYFINRCHDLFVTPADTVFESNFQTVEQGAEWHEGRGKNNNGEGHQAFVEQVATQSHIDPYFGVEGLVAATAGDLKTDVTNVIIERNERWNDHWVLKQGTPHRDTEPTPGSNWGPFWFVFPDTSGTLWKFELGGE